MGLAARLRRWLLPGYEDSQKTLQQLARQYTKHTADACARDAAIATQMSELATDVGRLAKQTTGIRERVAALQHAARLQRNNVIRAWRAAGPPGEYQLEQWRVMNRLDRLRDSSRRILVGPWAGEVGFELLYWIPFLTWALNGRGIDPDRLLVVSRGGTGLWYRHLTPHYADALTLMSPAEYRQRTEHSKKQRQWGAFDAEVLRGVRARYGRVRFDLLHSQMMVRLFQPIWRERVPLGGIDTYATYPRFERPEPSPWRAQLPDDYVAVKFYFSLQFPDTLENRQFAARVVRLLAKRTHVVLLGSGVKLDDHDDWRLATHGRIHNIDHLLSPESNLDVQTRVIAEARAFVGSYGGFSYLAPFYSVPSFSFYSDREGFLPYHLELAQRVFNRPGAATFLALDTGNVELIESLLGRWDDEGSEPLSRP